MITPIQAETPWCKGWRKLRELIPPISQQEEGSGDWKIPKKTKWQIPSVINQGFKKCSQEGQEHKILEELEALEKREEEEAYLSCPT